MTGAVRDLHLIAADVDRVAADLGASGQPFKNLAAALRVDEGRALSGVDLASAFGPEQLLPDRDDASVTLLLTVRNVAVLAPPAYTAWRLYEALAAHERSGGSGSFLAGWQQGFGHTVPTLADTGRTVALAAAAAVALSLVTWIVYAVRDGRGQRRRIQLSRLISEATLAVAAPVAAVARARHRLTRAATALKTSLQSTVNYFAGLSAGGRGGAAPGFHRASARLALRVSLLADEIVDAALAGEDVSGRLEEIRTMAERLSHLLAEVADDEADPGLAAAVHQFTDTVGEVIGGPADESPEPDARPLSREYHIDRRDTAR